jgi:hypothetical protein
MYLGIEFLRGGDIVREILARDGWRLTSTRAAHPAVQDGEAARERLDQLGLLTSTAVRISFPPQIFTKSSR